MSEQSIPATQATASATQAAEATVQATQVQVSLKSGSKHNQVAYLNEEGPKGKIFKGMMQFLKRSRIHRAISKECTAYTSHVTAFWKDAQVVRADRQTSIVGNVFDKEVIINQETIRQVCGFKDSADQPTKLNKYLVRGLFLRIKYDGDIEQGVLAKANLSPQYKFLCHILQHCLSPRKAGLDDMRETIQCAFAALVLNIPFNFSGMIMQHMIENLEVKKEKFLMYPRFVQMILNVQAPELPKQADDIIDIEVMKDSTIGRLQFYKGKSKIPIAKGLIGHLVKPDYVFPGGLKWRHDDSSSDTENIVVPKDIESENEEGETNVISSPTRQADNVGESSHFSLNDEDLESTEVEETAQLKRKRKTSSASISMNEFLKEKKKPKRFKLVLKEAETLGVGSSAGPPPAQVSQPPPATPTVTAPTASTSSAVVPSPEAAQIAALNTMFIQLMAQQTAQAAEIKRLSEMLAKSEQEKAEMAATIQKQQLQIEETNKQIVVSSQDQNQRILKIETGFTAMKESMEVGEDKILRLKVDDASDSGSDSDSTEDDSSDKETPAPGTKGNPLFVTPISKKHSKLTYILDMQGTIQYSVEYHPEEGEIVHNMTKEQIAELFELNPDEVIEPASESTPNLSDLEVDFDYDQVIIESASESDEDETTPVNEEPPVDDEIFNVDDSDLNRKVSEKDQSNPEPSHVSYEELRQEWLQVIRDCIRAASLIPDPSYERNYKIRGKGSAGKIISWAYLEDLNVYAVKRERGIDYFRRFYELKTLPYYDFMQLCRLKLLYSEHHDQAKWLEQRMYREFRGKWDLLRPQFPDISFSKTKTNPRTGRPLKYLKYKRTKVMKRIPLRKMRYDFHKSLRWWYYDNRTTEAVIVLDKDDDWEAIRVFDPMWLRNLSADDIYALYKCPIFYAIEDMDQAMRFNKVIKVCFAFDIHA